MLRSKVTRDVSRENRKSAVVLSGFLFIAILGAVITAV